jgi:hypothetical protein
MPSFRTVDEIFWDEAKGGVKGVPYIELIILNGSSFANIT